MVVLIKITNPFQKPTALNKKNPTSSVGFLRLIFIKSFYAFTFPFTFAITSSAMFVGAGA